MSATSPQTKYWRGVRCCLMGLAIVLTLVALFYTEELWRGKAAWESCKRELETKGVDLTWSHFIPAEIPEGENVFGVPEMQKWFTGHGATELSRKIEYPGLTNNRTARLLVAELKMELPGMPVTEGRYAVRWADPQASEQIGQFIKKAIGPMGEHQGSLNLLFTARRLREIHPAHIIVQCQTMPTADEMQRFLPLTSAITETFDGERLELASEEGGYKVTMRAPDSTEAFLRWNSQFKPEFALIRNALERPGVRMHGDYTQPMTVPMANFVTSRTFVQSLAAAARCHLLEQNPAEALADLTLIHDHSRIYTNSTLTLAGAMINSAVNWLYVDVVAKGLGWHAWDEPQLVALQAQLKSVDILPPVEQAFRLEGLGEIETLDKTFVGKLFDIQGRPSALERLESHFIPRGWIYQNMVVIARTRWDAGSWTDIVHERLLPEKINAAAVELAAIPAHSPYSFIAAELTPHLRRAYERSAVTQTKVDQAMIACALERYRLVHNEYPQDLVALVPQFLTAVPHDVIGGRPPIYHRNADGTFLLYSIGWSGRDGGGVGGKSEEQGDWVWPEPF